MSLTAMVKRQALKHRTAPEVKGMVSMQTPDGEIAEVQLTVDAPSEDERDSARNAISVLAHYIPSEVIAVYIAALAAIQQVTTQSKPIWLEEAFYFGGMVLVALFVVLAQQAERNAVDPQQPEELPPPIWPIVAGVSAFAIWALAIPQPEPIFQALRGYEPLIGVAAILSAFLLQMVEKALPSF